MHTTGIPLLDAHLAAITLRGLRPTTIKARTVVLVAFAASLPVTATLSTATRLDVEAWLSRPLAPESRRTYRAHLRAFYSWAVEEDHLTADPTAKVRPIRVRRGVPRPMADDDLGRALARADARMRAWLLLMALAGLRCLEVAALRPCDVIEQETGHVLFLRECKGGGTATVPAHPAILQALAAVPVRNGLWWDVRPGTLSASVNLHLQDCGVRATAHSLRHLAGTSWLRQSGYDLLTTAALLRHASVATTQVYAKLADERPGEVARGVLLRAV